MVNRYLVSLPVRNWKEASLLSSKNNWEILEALRKAGVEGLTPKEISDKTGIPKSEVYKRLKVLTRTEHSRKANLVEEAHQKQKWGAPTKTNQNFLRRTQNLRGRPSEIVFENIPWGLIKFDENFYYAIQPLLESYKDTLKGHWIEAMKSLIDRFNSNPDLNKFFPSEKIICEKCDWSHEAGDFLWALNLALVIRISEDEDFRKLAEKFGFFREAKRSR